MRVLVVMRPGEQAAGMKYYLIISSCFLSLKPHYLYIQDLGAIKPKDCMKNFLTILWVLITNVLTFADTAVVNN